MFGVLLLGGLGTRLAPSTLYVNKHFLLVNDKPMFYYPLSTLMLMGIRDIVFVSNKSTLTQLKNVMKTGSDFGCNFFYRIQDEPGGIPHAIQSASDLLHGNSYTVILGDNFFYGVGLGQSLAKQSLNLGAKIFCYKVKNPSDYGVVTISDGKISSIEEKPKFPKTNLAITGLYMFEGNSLELIKQLKKSKTRNEFEVTDLLNLYNANNLLEMEILPRGTSWLDMGSNKTINETAAYLHVIQERQGSQIASLEEIALNQGWITAKILSKYLESKPHSSYYEYLHSLI